MDRRREDIIDILTREFIGPDPIDMEGMIQDNGEEILSSDPPRIRYIAGVLFPQKCKPDSVIATDDNESVLVEEEGISSPEERYARIGKETIDDAEEMINLSNAYQQSAISLTASTVPTDRINVYVSAGVYKKHRFKDEKTGNEKVKYYRIPIEWNNNNNPVDLPSADNKTTKKEIFINETQKTNLVFVITYRYSINGINIYTFTLENAKVNNTEKVSDEDCYFQVGFSLVSEIGFSAMPKSSRINIHDNDYLSNELLYRNVKTYAIGHGCAVDWEDNTRVCKIRTCLIPSYEMKPIVPTRFSDISLSMYDMSDYGDRHSIISALELLCEKYKNWIEEISVEADQIDDKETAERHINNCRRCLERMRNGVELLRTNSDVLLAFQLMNRAMLLQQLHYNLPLQNWKVEDNTCFLENAVMLPDITNRETWYDNENRVYGVWRPFQLAFVLINLESMLDTSSEERKLVDLIWFPTGGGKTEAYLGLSAYTIFIRRLKNKDDSGTAILMRYTLRLLTSQQYDRASSMICACEIIRRQFEDKLGKSRITIGLWVGIDTTPNSMHDAVKAYDKIYKDKDTSSVDNNPIVVLKCPWCGAQMGVIRDWKQPLGYKKRIKGRKKSLILRCSNDKNGCDFANDSFALPLQIVDEDIYDNPPTLLLGTVDKFAMLPFRPEAQTIFGIHNGVRKTAPDLIIQDELHLISGPLGSMVGHYETMIHELCSYEKDDSMVSPKVIASTATISRADEQCQSLYGCKPEDVMQFPPSGLDAGNSFFAKEDKEASGRKYIGIFTPNSSSFATTLIRLYATLCYAAKKIPVENESERDAYWTNLGYFNSLRELGQTKNWIHADISEYLQVIYKRRYEDKEERYKEKRRYIYNDIELTSRIRSDKIPYYLQALGYQHCSNEDNPRPVDICLATNMVSVGVDVPRLGLMTVSGQPKTTSEYIQATSRVGRNSKEAPGLVVTVYNPGKPRDRSHYEQFKSYHSKVYCNVEPTSVTPFSAQLRERALHAVIVGILRLEENDDFNNDVPRLPDDEKIEYIKDIISERIDEVDPDEYDETMAHIDFIFNQWKIWGPKKFSDFRCGVDLPLMFPAGSERNKEWGTERGFPTPTSMRNVDASCEAYVLQNQYVSEDD